MMDWDGHRWPVLVCYDDDHNDWDYEEEDQLVLKRDTLENIDNDQHQFNSVKTTTMMMMRIDVMCLLR